MPNTPPLLGLALAVSAAAVCSTAGPAPSAEVLRPELLFMERVLPALGGATATDVDVA